MANDNFKKTSLKENASDPAAQPDTLPNAAEELNPANDQRSLEAVWKFTLKAMQLGLEFTL